MIHIDESSDVVDAGKCNTDVLLLLSIVVRELAHWGRDKMAAISKTTFANAFSWMKMDEFW